mgnify:CR=1 FL=1
MLLLSESVYQKMFGMIGEDAKGRHLCSCACNCSCHCRCGIYEEDEYESLMW